MGSPVPRCRNPISLGSEEEWKVGHPNHEVRGVEKPRWGLRLEE